MSQNYTVKIDSIESKRCTQDKNRHYELGEVQTVTVSAERSRQGRGYTYARDVVYRVEEGVASVYSIEPSRPGSKSSTDKFEPEAVAAILNETDAAVLGSLPDIEVVETLEEGMLDSRPDALDDRASPDTDKWKHAPNSPPTEYVDIDECYEESGEEELEELKELEIELEELKDMEEVGQ